MTTRAKRPRLLVVCSVLSGLIVCGSEAEEAAPRTGCGCGQGGTSQATETPAPAGNEKGIVVCPQYVWMDWGSYCSDYAQVHLLCDPVNLDHTNCQLPPGDCSDPDATNCVSTGFALLEVTSPLSPFVAGDLGSDGYGGNKVARRPDGALIPASSPQVNVTDIDSFIIKFPVRNNTAAYAQIFIARVAPKPPSKSPPAVLARGLEISSQGLLVDEIRHDYSTTPPSGTHVHGKPPAPVKGRGHLFQYQYGQLTIPIITHRETPGHGQ